MLNAVESRILVLATGCLLLLPATAFSQQALSTAPTSAEFLSRFDYSISMAKLFSPDPRFSWDGGATADIDVVDYVKGRMSIFAEYEVVMGNQLRTFDPNQGNYTLEGSSSWRIRKVEVAGVFHHLSRHLSDRENFRSVSYNGVRGRVMRHLDLARTSVDLRADLEKVVRHEFIDYSWTMSLHMIARRTIRPNLGLFGHAAFDTFGVDPAIAQRSQQNGGRLEGGVQLLGSRAAVQFFAGWEQVVDAYPIERASQRRSFIGLRLAAK